jgi:hypothetical protein
VLKLSAGDDHELNHIISVLLGYDEDDTAQKEDNSEQKNKIVALLEDTAYSHLLEVLFFSFLVSHWHSIHIFYTHKNLSPWGSSGPCSFLCNLVCVKIFTG